MAGHNAATFDVPILLRNGGHNFVTELNSVNIRCADTLLLFKSLIEDKHSSLQNEQGQFPKPNQCSLYEHLFKETFEAQDALEDVSALRRILFSSKVALSNEIIVNRSSLISVKDAAEDMKYLDDRHNRLLSFRGKLYHPGHQDSPVKQNIAEKMAGSGLQYEDLKNLFERFGRKGLVCVLSKPPLSARSSAPVVTKTRNDPQRPTTTHNDPQRSTTIHNDPQRSHNDPQRPTTTHNDPTTIPKRPTTIPQQKKPPNKKNIKNLTFSPQKKIQVANIMTLNFPEYL